jgi:hypothetical protein
MEYIAQRSSIHFDVHCVVTKHNYQALDKLVLDLARRKINCHLALVNLHPHGFNEFTSLDSAYMSTDLPVTEALQRVKALGAQNEIEVRLPLPFDEGEGLCGSFWNRFQTWPVKGIDERRYAENVIVGGCNAVVRGNLKSHGYILDYKNIMDLWNNEHFVRIRENLLRGVYPDEACSTCQSYKSQANRIAGI